MKYWLGCVIAALAWCVPPAVGQGSGDEPAIRVVTFNIRYGTADDKENAWPHRREMVMDRLRELDGDVVGLQEALRFQLSEVTEAVPGYVEVGVGREDGVTGGEYAPILVRTSRFTIAESGTFWLSDTPEVVASTHWGNDLTRICTWARLIEKETGKGVYVFNAHMDHRSQPARERSAELIAAKIEARAHADEPVVVMGDFNAGEGNPTVQYLRGGVERASDEAAWPGYEPPASPGLVDTFRAVHPDETEVGSFNGFRYGATTGEKIDHLLVTPGVEVLDAGIDRTSRDGRYPSDHFAVWATIRLP